jgi:shikimate dehydrogenase
VKRQNEYKKDMEKYGLLGLSLGHSFSKTYFNQKFESEHIDAEYVNFEIPAIKELKNIVKENPDLRGLNVTLPYKTAVIPLLDDIDEDAGLIGAVNVIAFGKGSFGKRRLKGYNSDILGFRQSIEPLLGETHRKALILGTGGASKAVFQGLKQLGVASTFVSRTPKDFCITYGEITPRILDQYRVIVNTTPVGMYPRIDNCPDIPYHLLTPGHLLYDLLYNPDETLFMQKGRKQGATVKNGLEMLLLQAFASWEIWHRKD